MSLVLLNALLILAGPFLVVSPLALAAHVQLSRPHARRAFRGSFRRPAFQVSFGWAVA
jgi:hypothetical protein